MYFFRAINKRNLKLFKIYLHCTECLRYTGKPYRTVSRSQTATVGKIVIIGIKLALIIMIMFSLQDHIQALYMTLRGLTGPDNEMKYIEK